MRSQLSHPSISSSLGTSLSLNSIVLRPSIPNLLQVGHHGLQPPLLLVQLGLQLLHDLDLHLGLGGAAVVQDMGPETEQVIT